MKLLDITPQTYQMVIKVPT